MISDIFVKLSILFDWLSGSFSEWREHVWRRDLDGVYCCDGRECGCGAQTIREVYKGIRP